jgi:hypothetical protein
VGVHPMGLQAAPLAHPRPAPRQRPYRAAGMHRQLQNGLFSSKLSCRADLTSVRIIVFF